MHTSEKKEVCGLPTVEARARARDGSRSRWGALAVEVRETTFADDASLYSRSIEDMQKIVDACMLFCGFSHLYFIVFVYRYF